MAVLEAVFTDFDVTDPSLFQGLTMNDLGGSPIFTGEEELFAFARVISRLTEMGTAQYASSTKTGVEESVW